MCVSLGDAEEKLPEFYTISILKFILSYITVSRCKCDVLIECKYQIPRAVVTDSFKFQQRCSIRNLKFPSLDLFSLGKSAAFPAME